LLGIGTTCRHRVPIVVSACNLAMGALHILIFEYALFP